MITPLELLYIAKENIQCKFEVFMTTENRHWEETAFYNDQIEQYAQAIEVLEHNERQKKRFRIA